MGMEVTPRTRDAAVDVVARWRPEARLEALPAGWAGMAPYRVATLTHTYCLKLPIEVDDEAVMARRRAGVRREAKRAGWAGDLTEVAPKIRYVDTATGAFATDFIVGEAPPVPLAQTSRRPIFSTLRRVHAAPLAGVPGLDQLEEHWLVPSADTWFAATRTPPALPVQAATHEVLRFIEAALGRDVPMQPLHNDLHVGNIIMRPDGEARFIDWNNLCVGDPMQDVGHLCCFTDTPHQDLQAVASDYTAAAPEGPPADLARLKLHTAWYAIKHQAFQSQWANTHGMRRELPRRLTADCNLLMPIFVAHGFRPPAVCR